MKTAYLLRAARLCALAAAITPGSALSQYAWVDDNGVRQFSDMPPPPSVPAARILKQPGAPVRSSPASVDAAAAPAATSRNLTELNSEFKKRRMEQAEKEKKTADESRQAEEKKKNCERAREHYQSLQSGQRIARTDSNGERAPLTDEQRAKEMRETSQVLNDCK